MADELDRLQAEQEAKASADLSRLLTEAVQDEAVREAAVALSPAAQGRPDGWPGKVTREVGMLYRRAVSDAFARLRGPYRNYEVETGVNARDGRPPEASATAVYKTRAVPGLTHIVKTGDTARSIARKHYGLVCYANRIWEENAHTFGPGCRQVPAGFPMVLSPADVPKWDRAPRLKAAPGTRVKAVRIVYPTLVLDLGSTAARKVAFATDDFAIEVVCRFRGDVFAQKSGTLEPDFALKSYAATALRLLGDALRSDFTLTAEDKRGTLKLTVGHKRVRALGFSGQVRLSPGAPKVRLSGGSGDLQQKDHTFRLFANVEAVLRVIPRRTGKPVQRFETGLSVSSGASAGGFARRPLLAPRGSAEAAAPRGAAAALGKLGVA